VRFEQSNKKEITEHPFNTGSISVALEIAIDMGLSLPVKIFCFSGRVKETLNVHLVAHN